MLLSDYHIRQQLPLRAQAQPPQISGGFALLRLLNEQPSLFCYGFDIGFDLLMVFMQWRPLLIGFVLR